MQVTKCPVYHTSNLITAKGTPVERRGRKASGLTATSPRCPRQRGRQKQGPPPQGTAVPCRPGGPGFSGCFTTFSPRPLPHRSDIARTGTVGAAWIVYRG